VIWKILTADGHSIVFEQLQYKLALCLVKDYLLWKLHQSKSLDIFTVYCCGRSQHFVWGFWAISIL